MTNPYDGPVRKQFLRLLKIAPQIQAVGSRVTCDPAPQGNDADFLVHLLNGQEFAFYAAIREDGWELGGSIISDDINKIPTEDRFYSYRLLDVNLIVTESQTFAHRFLAATSIAKRLNLLEKQDRIALFQAVLYGRIDPETPLFNAKKEDEIAF